MTTYTAYFRTDAEFATCEIKAATPEQALKKARRLYDRDPLGLEFESYYEAMPVNEIAINDANNHELAVWLDEDLRLRLAASDVLEAAELVVARWSEGDLAEAVRQLDAAIGKAKGGAAYRRAPSRNCAMRRSSPARSSTTAAARGAVHLASRSRHGPRLMRIPGPFRAALASTGFHPKRVAFRVPAKRR
jgi:hypothetical protein